MEKASLKERFVEFMGRIKFELKNNIVTMILGICTIVPIIIALNIFDGNAVIGLAVVPVIYRLICNIILWIVKKAGRPENTNLFNGISRISVFIGFFILCCLSVALGREKMGIIEIILFSLVIAYFDKVLIIIAKSFFGVMATPEMFMGSGVDNVGSLMSSTKTTFERPDGAKIYKDANGRTVGMSRYNEKTGETTYWNENMKYVGKSTSNGNTKTYFDSKLNYEGKSEKQSNGNTNYYDKNLNYKGKSRDNSNKTTTHFKE